MKKELIVKKLEKIFYECDKHLLRIAQASNNLESTMPLDEKKYLNLTNEKIQALDQFLFRFAKLQDAIGQKLFRNILLYLGEDIEGKPFIDILNLMEKLYLLDNMSEWRELREDRNELAHNYEDEAEMMSATINNLYNKKEILKDVYLKIKKFYQKREKVENLDSDPYFIKTIKKEE
jgi:hypothetical protein